MGEEVGGKGQIKRGVNGFNPMVFGRVKLRELEMQIFA
jgi:hypothetical protein